MPLQFQSKLAPISPQWDLTPLVDVLFCLLFFILCLAPAQSELGGLFLPPEKHSFHASTTSSQMRLLIDAKGQLFLGPLKKPIEKQSLTTELTPSSELVICADPRVSWGYVAEIFLTTKDHCRSVTMGI